MQEIKEEDRGKIKWYFKNFWVVAAILSFGPLALPLVWFNPRYTRMTKIVVTFFVGLVCYMLWVSITETIEKFHEYMKMYGL